MISITDVRSAVLSDKPWTQLDALVRREMAIGRRVMDIFDELKVMIDEVDESPGITEDGSDAFLDTLDALIGNCHANSCYTDPPAVVVTTPEAGPGTPTEAPTARPV